MGQCCGTAAAAAAAGTTTIPFDLAIPFILSDDAGTILRANAAAHRLFRVRAGSALEGTHIERLMPPDVAAQHAAFMRRYITTGKPRVIGTEGREVTARRADGTDVLVLLTLHRCPQGFLAAFVDLEATRIMRVRADFIRYLSHEVRVPLNALTLGLESLIDGGDALAPSARGEILDDMRECADGILHLLNDVLDLEKMDDGAFTFTFGWARLPSLVRRAVKVVGLARARDAASEAIHVNLAVAPSARGVEVFLDAARVLQVLNNFLSNACRHTPAGGHITVGASLEAMGDETPACAGDAHLPARGDATVWASRVRLWVFNEGSSIPNTEVAKVFTPFTQVHTHGPHRGGGGGVPTATGQRTGLGLSICKQIICQGHAGSVAARSDARGMTFEATMVLRTRRVSSSSMLSSSVSSVSDVVSPAQCHAHVATDSSADTDTDVDVLCVDDSAINLRQMRRTLEGDGLSVAAASDGKEAVAWFAAGHRCGVVLMDRSMPVMDGLDATRAILRIAPTQVVVGLTGDVMEADVREMRAAGAAEVLSKPVARADLLRAVRSFAQSADDDLLT